MSTVVLDKGPLARERIEQALDGRSAEVEWVEVTDDVQAARLGMTGSPTVLIDGTDPWSRPTAGCLGWSRRAATFGA